MKSWPHGGHSWLRAPCLLCPGTLGFHKTPLAMMATTWHLLGSRKKVPLFSFSQKTPLSCWWELFHQDSALWLRWVLKLAPRGGLQSCKVGSEWQSFPHLQKTCLFWGQQGGCGRGVGKANVLFGKNGWGAVCCSQRAGKIIAWKGAPWENISLVLLPRALEARLPATGVLVSSNRPWLYRND